jgi:hypothetical protein
MGIFGWMEEHERKDEEDSGSDDPRHDESRQEDDSGRDDSPHGELHEEDEAEDDSGRDDSRNDGSEDDDEVKKGTAPSAADITKLEKFEPSEEAKRTEPSQEDAMGMDKRRQVVGGSHGPSRKSQILFFASVALILIVVVGGYALAIAAFDQPEKSYPDKAPWSQAGAAQYDTGEPSDPCGEPGNPHPAEPGSPCLSGSPQGEAGGGLPGGSGKTQSGSSNQAEE